VTTVNGSLSEEMVYKLVAEKFIWTAMRVAHYMRSVLTGNYLIIEIFVFREHIP